MSANGQSAEMSRLKEAGSRGEKRRVEQNYDLDWIQSAIFGLNPGSKVKPKKSLNLSESEGFEALGTGCPVRQIGNPTFPFTPQDSLRANQRLDAGFHCFFPNIWGL
jgi:hypothetical protein